MNLVLIVSVHGHCILLQCSKRSESQSIDQEAAMQTLRSRGVAIIAEYGCYNIVT